MNSQHPKMPFAPSEFDHQSTPFSWTSFSASLWLWVAMTMATPASLFRRRRSSPISSPVAQSRFPVGSSPRINHGVHDQGPGNGHALLLSTGKLPGPMGHAPFQTHITEHIFGHAGRLFSGMPGDQGRHSWHFPVHLIRVTNDENWNTNPISRFRTRDKLRGSIS